MMKYDSVAVKVLGFGIVRICMLMPTFQRNTLLPSSGAEVGDRLPQQHDNNGRENLKSQI
jgi:hypothetical protein